MSDIPWTEHAVMTQMGSDGFRTIIFEGTLEEVAGHIARFHPVLETLCVSLPERSRGPSMWVDKQVLALIKSYDNKLKLDHPAQRRATR